MATEPSRVELLVSNHPWLMSGLGAAVDHFAERAGFDEAARRDLIEAAVQACQNAFPLLLNSHDTLRVLVEDSVDRVEIALEYQGEALPSAGLETFAGLGGESGASGDLAGLALMARVDRVLYSTEGGSSRMTLVKYAPPARK